MSLCDVCMSPGACCRRIHLSGGPNDDPVQLPRSRESAEHMVMRQSLPFVPGHQLEDGTWQYWCTKLQADGRCGDYENRPDLCRRYAPASDGLCVHYWEDPDDLPTGKEDQGQDDQRPGDAAEPPDRASADD